LSYPEISLVMLIHQKRIRRRIRNTKVLRYILDTAPLSYLIQYIYPICHHSSISRQTLLTILFQQMTNNVIQYITLSNSRSPTTNSLINSTLHILTQSFSYITHLHHITTSPSKYSTNRITLKLHILSPFLLTQPPLLSYHNSFNSSNTPELISTSPLSP